MSSSGRKPSSATPSPARLPSRPAWGTRRWTELPRNEQTVLANPMSTIVAMPRYHVARAASRSGIPWAFMPRNAGPRITRAIPRVEGVSRPRGMAVMSLRPEARARRRAMAT